MVGFLIIGILIVIIVLLLITNQVKYEQLNVQQVPNTAQNSFVKITPDITQNVQNAYTCRVPKVQCNVLTDNVPINQQYQIQHDTNQSGDKLIMYYTNWCGISQQFKPIWDQFINQNNTGVIATSVNCENEQDKCKLSGIKGYPTIILHKVN